MTRFLIAAIVSLTSISGQLFAQQNIVETASAAGQFNTLLTAAKAAGLADTLATGNFTVFAPTDEAFAKVNPVIIEDLLKPENKAKLAAVLTYHVVPGSVRAADAYSLPFAKTVNGQRLELNIDDDSPNVGGASIVKTDIECSNGVIHIIDSVLLPAEDTIPAVASNAGTFQTLLAAVTEAGLAETLGSAGPFTVFAPTDDAFQKLPAGTVDELLQPANRQKLVNILKYHVVAGRVYDDQAVKAGNASTLLGQSVRVTVSEQGLAINDAKIVAKNMEASNGVIHAIDSVLLPSDQVTPAKVLSPGEAVEMLNAAVMQGVPQFNSGHHQACCDTYTAVLQTLNRTGVQGVPAHTMTMIQNTLSRAQHNHNATNRAWTLRHGVDSAMAQFRQMPMVSMTR